MIIEGHESCRVPIPVDRCPLSKLAKLYTDGQHTNPSDGEIKYDSVDLDKICSEHVASLVDLRWHLLSSETKGSASVKGITLTPNMLDIVRMSPLQWGNELLN